MIATLRTDLPSGTPTLLIGLSAHEAHHMNLDSHSVMPTPTGDALDSAIASLADNHFRRLGNPPSGLDILWFDMQHNHNGAQ